MRKRERRPDREKKSASPRGVRPELGVIRKPWPGRIHVALCYPNTYPVAMGNLGFHQVYHLFNLSPDVVCERVVLPQEPGPPLSLESGRPLRDFDIVAFSLSYESDLLHLAHMLHQARLPLDAGENPREDTPLILAGGVIAFLNPEPLAPFCDVIAVGEAEPILPSFLSVFREHGRKGKTALLQELAPLPGLYVPSLYELRYEAGGEIAERRPLTPGAPAQVQRLWVKDLSVAPACTRVFSEEAEFGDMFLLELMRGCVHACRFCAGAFIYRPPRFLPAPAAEESLANGLRYRDKAGLVAATPTAHPELSRIMNCLHEQGKLSSLSSLRLDEVTPQLIAEIKAAGHRTLTLAPEAATERLRRLINKPITNRQLLSTLEMIGAAGLPRLKLYFQIGLPEEKEEDIDAFPDLLSAIKTALSRGAGKRSWATALSLSVNPFIPKPGTPFQWAPLESASSLRQKLQFLQRAAKKIGGFSFSGTSVREAQEQAVIARGDRRIGALVRKSVKTGTRLLPLLSAQDSVLPGLEWYAHRPREFDELLPWDFIDHGLGKNFLWQEYQKALAGKITPPCRPGTCQLCPVCSKAGSAKRGVKREDKR